MEVLGFLSAVLGVIAAVINRKRIIVLRYDHGVRNSPSHTGGGPITIRKRMKRLLLALTAAMAFPCIAGAAGASGDSEGILVFAFAAFLLVAAYQLVAIFLLAVVRLWR